MQRGECKTPGGKLVIAEFEVKDGKIAWARVSGDFFLYPDSALALIDSSLVGAWADATTEELAARIQAALPAGVEMLGFSPMSVAEAVRRGTA